MEQSRREEIWTRLLEVVARLRAPDGCPWDRKQTHASLAPYALEEAAELAEALESGSDQQQREELGDVLLQVCLNTEIATERGAYTMEGVVEGLTKKLIERHPHVFPTEAQGAEVSATKPAMTAEEVTVQWDEIKKRNRPATQADLDPEASPQSPDRFPFPLHLSSLHRAAKIGKRTQKLDFHWPDVASVWKKVAEELAELKAEIPVENSAADRGRLVHEIGDLVFAISQLSIVLDVDLDQSLREANRRFEHRFFQMRKMIRESGRDWNELNDAQKEEAWQETKRRLRDQTSSPGG